MTPAITGPECTPTRIGNGAGSRDRNRAVAAPDFHRLDRTSLRLAHSFDPLVAARQERLRLWHEVCAPSRLAYGRSRMRTPFIYRAGCRTSGALLFFAGWRALRPRKTEAAF